MTKMPIGISKVLILFLWGVIVFLAESGWAVTDEEIERMQPFLKEFTLGEKIAFWAEKFVGVPYDEDPKGIYVTQEKIVVDEKVDCMYLPFRAVELALSRTPEEAIEIALDKRFRHQGELRGDGSVANYEDRFQYGEDMILSRKWGRDITGKIGPLVSIPATRGKKAWEMLTSRELLKGLGKLKSGDIVFFVVSPAKRKVGEIIGHMGIIKAEEGGQDGKVYLIHASGAKNKGGVVKKVLLADYLREMPFIGVNVTRFE